MQKDEKLILCSSPEKQESICFSCARNIDMWNILGDDEFENFEIKKVRNLKNKTFKYICSGYINKDKKNEKSRS